MRMRQFGRHQSVKFGIVKAIKRLEITPDRQREQLLFVVLEMHKQPAAMAGQEFLRKQAHMLTRGPGVDDVG